MRSSAKWARALERIFAGRVKWVAVLLLAACGTSPDLPKTGAIIAGYDGLGVGPGDILEITFFPTGATSDRAYLLRPGDVLSVQVFGHPDISRDEVVVLPDGTVALDGVPQAVATGKTPNDLAEELTAAYRRRQLRDAVVSVSVKAADVRVQSLTTPSLNMNNRFEITVDQEGVIDLPFIDPVSTQSGLRAIQDRVRQAYDAEFAGLVDVTVNLKRRLPPRVFVVGQVVDPGEVAFRRPMTTFMAVSAAGGFAPTANASEVRVLRADRDGTFQIVALDLRRGLEGQLLSSGDFALRDQDIVYVPMSGVVVANTRVEQFIREMLPPNLGLGLVYDVSE
ncbi:MAG: polysaccharide biosynthesis/export family protein [Pseudomonadota bacterium]